MGTEASDMMALVRSGAATAESVREMIAVGPKERAELVSMGLRDAVRCRDRILAEFDALASDQAVPETAPIAPAAPRTAPARPARSKSSYRPVVIIDLITKLLPAPKVAAKINPPKRTRADIMRELWARPEVREKYVRNRSERMKSQWRENRPKMLGPRRPSATRSESLRESWVLRRLKKGAAA